MCYPTASLFTKGETMTAKRKKKKNSMPKKVKLGLYRCIAIDCQQEHLEEYKDRIGRSCEDCGHTTELVKSVVYKRGGK